MKLSLIALLFMFSINALANATPTTVACKLKDDQKNKQKFSINLQTLNDEKDISYLPADQYVTITSQGMTALVAAGNSPDDECMNGTTCRNVIYLKLGTEPAVVGYANDATKVGVLSSGYKLSCTF